MDNIIIHFYLSPECMMKCDFCYAFERKVLEKYLDIYEIEELIIKCKELGAKSIVFCGGDPFVRTDIVDVVKLAHNYELITRIDSNLLSYNRNIMEKINPFLNWIALPIDGPNANIHDAHRKWEGHFNMVLKEIEVIKRLYPVIKIKIQTLVTKENYKHIFEMYPIINKIDPAIWSVYTYFRAGIGRENYKKYELSENQIECVKKMKDVPTKYKIDIVSSESHKNAYIFVTADGRVYRQPNKAGENYHVYSNFKEGALSIAKKYLDIDANIRRLKNIS
jgi:MoaA/NifB/PqqE/SkfB family radical SAM enzyme